MRKVIEWVPDKFWVVDSRETGYTPLYEGKGKNRQERKADAERWMSEKIRESPTTVG
jgi:hypothetical protein